MNARTHCASCKRARDYGCRFDCPDRKPPSRFDNYRGWADQQKEHYARGETPGEDRKEIA